MALAPERWGKATSDASGDLGGMHEFQKFPMAEGILSSSVSLSGKLRKGRMLGPQETERERERVSGRASERASE